MRILHVIPVFWPAHRYGGPVQTTLQLCRNLVAMGHDVRVMTTDADGRHDVLNVDTSREVDVEGVRVRYFPRRFPETIAPGLLRALPEALGNADIIHLTAVYSFPTLPALLLARLMAVPVIWSVHGSLQRHPGTRNVALKAIWEGVCVGAAPSDVRIHVTSHMELDESRARLPGGRFALVPNGVEIPSKAARSPRLGGIRFLFLGRLHPQKGLDNLLRALARMQRDIGNGWSLTLAGRGEEDYERRLRALVSASGLEDRVAFAGEVLGAAKDALFDAHDVLILPSHRENFGLVVAEGLAHGLAVIASRGTPWEEVQSRRCGLWVDNDPASLAHAMETIATLPVVEMGDRGRRWMAADYSWPEIAKRMSGVYESLVRTSAPGPATGRG